MAGKGKYRFCTLYQKPPPVSVLECRCKGLAWDLYPCEIDFTVDVLSTLLLQPNLGAKVPCKIGLGVILAWCSCTAMPYHRTLKLLDAFQTAGANTVRSPQLIVS